MLKNLIEHIRIFVKRKKNALKFAHKFPTSETTLNDNFSRMLKKIAIFTFLGASSLSVSFAVKCVFVVV